MHSITIPLIWVSRGQPTGMGGLVSSLRVKERVDTII